MNIIEVSGEFYLIGLVHVLYNRLFCSIFVQKQGLKVALPLKGEIESDRFGGWPADERWGYLKVSSDEEIDEELLEWIKLAYRKVMEG
ncbi:MAG: hypothetical protein ACXQTS_04130 [Candidatus Methanospirareceae archaeon]